MIRHKDPGAQPILHLVMKEQRVLNKVGDIRIAQVTASVPLIEVHLNAPSHQRLSLRIWLELQFFFPTDEYFSRK
jgi:hypothetical protein